MQVKGHRGVTAASCHHLRLDHQLSDPLLIIEDEELIRINSSTLKTINYLLSYLN